jgi:hypothetical protein
MVMVPDRVRRNESFRKRDHARARRAGLGDQPTGFFGRAFAVEENASGLHGRHLDHRIRITHARTPPVASPL